MNVSRDRWHFVTYQSLGLATLTVDHCDYRQVVQSWTTAYSHGKASVSADSISLICDVIPDGCCGTFQTLHGGMAGGVIVIADMMSRLQEVWILLLRISEQFCAYEIA